MEKILYGEFLGIDAPVSKETEVGLRFYVEGKKVTFQAGKERTAEIRNRLAPGYAYQIKVEGKRRGCVHEEVAKRNPNESFMRTKGVLENTSAYADQGAEILISDMCISSVREVEGFPVVVHPGLLTVKNFLAAALRPVGSVLYIFGGGWNWQDTGGNDQARQTGLSEKWLEFFRSQDEGFAYRSKGVSRKPDRGAVEYYPVWGCNVYNQMGLDCSGYVGWAVYNTLFQDGMRQENEKKRDCVVRASCMAWEYAGNFGLGSFLKKDFSPEEFQPGDIFSMEGHVWICLGVCQDRSMVILHSTPSASRAGYPGGGVQLGALGERETCLAYGLADFYMKKYCPQWYRRYQPVRKDYRQYTDCSGEFSGRFRWYPDVCGLSDPEGICQMDAGEVLETLVV